VRNTNLDRNYCVSTTQPIKYVFFTGPALPEEVERDPMKWASWFPTSNQSVRLISENSDAFCTRNGHSLKVRGCKACFPSIV
jgi:hypothetical protein